MNIEHLTTYLTLLEPDVEHHEFYWAGLHPDGRRIQAYGRVDEILLDLVARNGQGFGIFTCVNAITKVVDEHGIARRKATQVHRVRAVFADWDNVQAGPSWPLPLEPSLLVGTSPNKFHIYWLVDDLPLEQFEPVQRAIAAALGSDPSVCDLSREMRVPGFLHTKGEPVEVRLLEYTGRRYSAAEILAAFPAEPRREHSGWDGSVRTRAAMTAAIVAHCYPQRDDGGFNIPCPWADQHTSKSNPSETTYFPPSELNGGQGFFKCMHAHCARRFASDFDEWIDERVRRSVGQ
jgi:hypothetical protein